MEHRRFVLSVAVGVRLALSSWLVLGGPVRAQQPQGPGVELAELEAHARKARGALSGSDARIQAARARVDAARSAYSPTLNLLGEAYAAPGGRLLDLRIGPDGQQVTYKVAGAKTLDQTGAFEPTARYGITLDAHATLYDFGRTASAVDAAEAARSATQAEAQRDERDIVRDVRAAYVRWAAAYALWSLSERAAHAAEEREKRALASIAEGAVRTADRTAAEIDTQVAQLELERSHADLESAREDLGFLAMFDLPPEAYPGDDPLRVGLHPSQPVPEDASLRALHEQRRAARATARVHDHAFAPVIAASAQAGVQGNMGSVFPLYRVGLTVSVPLWDGGAETANRTQAEARAAELAAESSRYEQSRQQQQKKGELLGAQAERRIRLAEKLVQLCGKRLAQLEDAYPLGAAPYADVVEARGALSHAQTELVLAQALRAEAALELY
jgi:multidrug efflux system outer membrane protein